MKKDSWARNTLFRMKEGISISASRLESSDVNKGDNPYVQNGNSK